MYPYHALEVFYWTASAFAASGALLLLTIFVLTVKDEISQ